MTWFQDGVRFKIYVSTDGDFVSLGTRTEYPFVAGGAGIPVGWTKWIEAGADADVNWTTQNGRWSVSNASDTNAHNTGKYNIYRDFPVTYGHRYILQAQAQTMDGKSSAYRWISYQPNATKGPYSIQLPSVTPWEQLAWVYTPLSDETFVRIFLKVNPYWSKSADFKFDWGVQFQNFAIVDQLATYPDPTWHEVTCDVRTLTTKYGRAKFTNRYDVGTAQIVINNNDGEFTYDPHHEWGLRPGRFIKVEALLPGGNPTFPYPCFYGIIDSLADTYTLDGKAIVNVQCVDTSSLLSNTEVPTASPESTTYYSGGRFRALYGSVGWLPQMASTDTGVFQQQPIRANGRTVRDELGLIADSEGSTFYTDRWGRLVYRERGATTMARWNSVYGELLANCPDYVYKTQWIFPGIASNYTSVPHAAGQNIVTADFAFRCSMNNMMGAGQTFMAKGTTWFIRKSPNAKTVSLFLGGPIKTTTAALPYNDGDVFWLRVQRNTVNELRVFHCPDTGSNGIPNTSSMALLGSVLTASGAIGTSTEPVYIGARVVGGTTDPFNGRMYRATMYDAYLTGSIIIDADPYLWDGLEGASSVPLYRPTGVIMEVLTTGDNELIVVDSTQPPTGLVPVDNIPTVVKPTIVFLQALATDWSRDRVVNDVQLANQNGSAFQYVDYDSQSKYGPRTYQRMDLLNVNDHPEYLDARAQDLMDGYTDAMLRVNSVDFRPNLDTYSFALNMFLNDLVRVRYEHPTGGWGYAVVSHVQSIQQTISTNDWQVQLLLDDAEAFNRWDTAVGTGWDEGVWDESLWDGYVVGQWSRDSQWSDNKSVWG